MTMQTDDATLDGAGPRDDVCCVGACCIRPKGVGRRALHLALAVALPLAALAPVWCVSAARAAGVYLSRATSLPCEQIATITRHATSGSGTFTQTSTNLWSRFNDSRLTVPAIPTA